MSDEVLYIFHKQAIAELDAVGGASYNWIKSTEFKVANLKSMVITDVEESAKKWRLAEAPLDFYFTHAQFYGDGIDHIVSELKRKPTSNRALYSLINQENINLSGDDPIPSFLTMQCQIGNKKLVCTCTFRALEVSHFLRVNLEEIRQTLCEITSRLPEVADVFLSIFAFRAYVQVGLHPLVKPKISYLKDYDIFPSLAVGAPQRPLTYLIDLLKDAQGALTIVPADRLRSLKDMIATLSSSHVKLDKEIAERILQINPALDSCISAAEELAHQRSMSSHGEHVAAATTLYKERIAEIVRILEA